MLFLWLCNSRLLCLYAKYVPVSQSGRGRSEDSIVSSIGCLLLQVEGNCRDLNTRKYFLGGMDRGLVRYAKEIL